MAVTQNQAVGGTKQMDEEHGSIVFTSTTATVELATSLSRVYCATFTRVGDADADDAGYLVIDETASTDDNSDVYIDSSSGAFTVDRQALTGTGTLTGETFLYTLKGTS